MKKLIFVTIILIVSIFLAVRTQSNSLPSSFFPKFNSNPSSTKPTATIDGHTFQIEIAKSAQDKEAGLTKYNSIKEDFGMYFPFDREGIYPFWMKNMKFPIDILFLNNNKIINIEENAQPVSSNSEIVPTYAPQNPSNAVLEISAGLSKKYGFKIGDELKTSGL